MISTINSVALSQRLNEIINSILIEFSQDTEDIANVAAYLTDNQKTYSTNPIARDIVGKQFTILIEESPKIDNLIAQFTKKDVILFPEAQCSNSEIMNFFKNEPEIQKTFKFDTHRSKNDT